MIDYDKKRQQEEERQNKRKHYTFHIDEDNYEFFPAKKTTDYYDNDVNQRVGIYARVSTKNIQQTSSYEMQKQYYEEFVKRHPSWTLVDIYADEGISGTSLKHRDNFMRMIQDCKAGKLDLIITKSVSRFARNVVDFIGIVRSLAELKPPVGVFFESEAIFSLNDDSQIALSFQATMAEEESHTRSRGMESSLRMRLDHGLPLTPKLLGYTHDADGHLIINPDEAHTVKLVFFMYLYGYSTSQIASALIALERRSYLGNIKWSSGSIVQILRNERHCGDVYTRKTYTENFRTHRKLKNRGERPISHYLNHHEGIVSRDDFIAVQRMLDNSKYRNKTILPELRVIEDGLFKGYVIVNPRWSGFKEMEYFQAAKSVYDESNEDTESANEVCIEVEPGDFDLRGFEIARTEFFDSKAKISITFERNKILLSAECIKKLKDKKNIELLINPITRKVAVRPTDKDNRNAIVCSKLKDGKYQPRPMSSAAFSETLFSLYGWNMAYKYRLYGAMYENDGEVAFIFDGINPEAFIKNYYLPSETMTENGVAKIQPLTQERNHVRAIPKEWTESFGMQFYVHEQSLSTLKDQSEEDWMMRLQGRLFETGKKLNVTGFDELKEYITQELKGIDMEEVQVNG